MVATTSNVEVSTNNSGGGKLLRWRQRVGYWLYETGRFTAILLIQTYLMIYMTDTARLSVAAVGTLFLVCKIIDAITDYLAGLLIDRTNSRFGKSRPWAFLGVILVTVGLLTVFNIPSDWASNSQLVYAYVTYCVFSLGLTFLNIPEFTILPTLSDDPEERSVFATSRQVAVNVIKFFATPVSAALLVFFFVNGFVGYAQVAQLVTVFVVVCIVVSLLLLKEIYVDNVSADNDEEEQPKHNLLKASVLILKNRRFWLFGLMAAFISFAFMMTLMCGAYYFKNVMDNPIMQGTAMMCLSGAQFIGMFLTPMLGKKYSKRVLIMVGIIMGELGYFGLYLAQPALVLVSYFIIGFGFSIAFTMYFALMPELFDYLEYEIGHPVSGITSSLTQYLVKVGETLNNVAIAWVLVIGQYDASLEVQKAVTKLAIRLNISLIPGIIGLLGLLCVFFLDLEKLYPTVRAALNKRQGKVETENVQK